MGLGEISIIKYCCLTCRKFILGAVFIIFLLGCSEEEQVAATEVATIHLDLPVKLDRQDEYVFRALQISEEKMTKGLGKDWESLNSEVIYQEDFIFFDSSKGKLVAVAVLTSSNKWGEIYVIILAANSLNKFGNPLAKGFQLDYMHVEDYQDKSIVAEKLSDLRQKTAKGLRVNKAANIDAA